ncbi:replication restart helicase PriA [Flexithrix dorotheae]|uniref:replication restart helicase PriA n=1 Tax=Flexithrix dorotheae TaxID=70993 RepID=UPI0003804790|nr:primosomal protein N' [Flexithrix dorotheae]
MDHPHTERKTLFADILLPVPLAQYFTYRVPFDLNENVIEGGRVIVQFGRRRVLTGIVVKIHENPPQNYEAKYILENLDENPVVNSLQIQFWEWIAEYYMCTVGEVMNVAIPSGLKLSSQSRIQINPEFDFENASTTFTEQETKLIQVLRENESLPYDQASEILDSKNIYQIIKYLIAKRAILIFEEVKEKYKPKVVKKIRLNPELALNEESLEKVFNALKSNSKQEQVLLKYLSQVPIYSNPLLNEKGIQKSIFLNDEHNQVSPSSLKTLVKNQIMEEFDEIVSRFEDLETSDSSEMKYQVELSDRQKKAREEILEGFNDKEISLLFGITGSGKTEIYVSLIKDAIESGSQVLLLLPEIVLTTQMVIRLKKIFGGKVGVYHSRFSDNERVEVWRGVAEGTFSFVVGVRSSIFLPFSNLSLIIVDEEHDSSYKQYDPAPRYNARDSAMILGRFHHAKVLLGSATPSVESYFLAKRGNYGLVRLQERFGGVALPEIQLVNTLKEKKQKKMKGEFSSVLVEEIEKNIENEKQTILFQNRRGYAPYLMCEDCGWIPKCDSCSVSLTYHMYRNTMVCHYCGYKEALPRSCVSCGSTKIVTVGIGTEKIEDELKAMLPNINVGRMDLETTRKKYSYQKILNDFANKQIDVLVGTQMVSKGLDFDHVDLVGIFDIDRLIHFPDFRSHEKTFQLITQVSGRAGRRASKGLVLIQTGNPKQPLLNKIASHDYEGFFSGEIKERQNHLYPPFTRLIRITVKHENREARDQIAEKLAIKLKNSFGTKMVLGPENPIIDKIRNFYLKDILIKMRRGGGNLKKQKEIIKEAIESVRDTKRFKQFPIVVDVDCL